MDKAQIGRRSAESVALAAVLVLAGCGMPGAPLPPSLNLPNPVTDLVATRTGGQLRLSWTMPRKNTDKLLLKGNVEVRVCRKDVPAGHCAPAGTLQLAPGAVAVFEETLAPGLAEGLPRALSYFVELTNRSGRSAGLSNEAVVVAGAAPAPVAGLHADVRKEGVVLRWSPAADEPATTVIRLHRTLLTPPAERKIAAKTGPLAPPPEPVQQNLIVDAGGHASNRALDKDIRFGEAYEYRAQRIARFNIDGRTLELDGPLSAPVRVEAMDVFPPAVPRGLAAVAIAGDGVEPAIDLNWQPNTEPDLAGYAVYRREPGDSSRDWTRISPAQPVVGPAFRDDHVQPGHRYSYAVIAIDQGGHQSGKSAPAEETVPGP